MTVDHDQFLSMFAGTQQDDALSKLPSVSTEQPKRAIAPLGERLERTAQTALDKADEVLAIPLNADSPHYAAVLRAQTSTINTTLTVQTRVDEAKLRVRSDDTLQLLLDRMNAEEAKLTKNASLDASEK